MLRAEIDADVFLFDLDGTVFLGDTPIGDSLNTLKKLEALGKTIFFLTNNSSKDKKEYVTKLTKLGYPAKIHQIVSSTLASIQYLKTRCPGKSVFPVGTKAFENELKSAGIEIKEDGADILLLAFDTTLTYDKIWKANVLLEKGKEFFATHPDIVCPSDIGDMPDVGSLMALLECSSGRGPSVICGKPYSPMAEIIESLVSVPRDRIMMIGDRLYTDILFGINNGYKSMLVFSGETTPQMLADSGIKPTYTLPTINDLIV
ncbi:MAG: HAD-IIA family hydrolase [Firmicutes bacterium]|nr:HAD-IIA family hydrolase [Bacillota bacterium]